MSIKIRSIQTRPGPAVKHRGRREIRHGTWCNVSCLLDDIPAVFLLIPGSMAMRCRVTPAVGKEQCTGFCSWMS